MELSLLDTIIGLLQNNPSAVPLICSLAGHGETGGFPVRRYLSHGGGRELAQPGHRAGVPSHHGRRECAWAARGEGPVLPGRKPGKETSRSRRAMWTQAGLPAPAALRLQLLLPTPLLPGLPARSACGQDPDVHRSQPSVCCPVPSQNSICEISRSGQVACLNKDTKSFSSGGTAPRVCSFKIFLSNMPKRVLICVWLTQRRVSSRWATWRSSSCVQPCSPPTTPPPTPRHHPAPHTASPGPPWAVPSFP